MRDIALICIAILGTSFVPGIARAETCFNACFRPQLVGTDIQDSRIRAITRRCHDVCADDAERRLSLSGRSEKLLNCEPAPLSQDEFRRVRAASLGLGGSGPDHWQTRWEQKLSTARRVHQRDWDKPQRDEWVGAIATAIQTATRPVILVAHPSAPSPRSMPRVRPRPG
jgi:Serine hydrolase